MMAKLTDRERWQRDLAIMAAQTLGRIRRNT
jgi:hypothetical protein